MSTARRELTQTQWFDALGIDPFWIVDEQPIAQPITQPDARPAAASDVQTQDVTVADSGCASFEQSIRGCKQCGLARHRKQAVPGSGDTQATWLLVGEAPGADEDRAGLPFVGQSGKLLDAMLASLGLNRQKGVYLTNAVKCHPEEEHTPTANEMDACQDFLCQQIALIQPKVILALGRSAAYAVLGQEASLQSLRGTVHYRQQAASQIPVVVTYHPAYLLREPAEKWKSWQDLILARNTLTSM